MNQKNNHHKTYYYFGLGFIAILCFIVFVVKYIDNNKNPNSIKTAITIDDESITIAELNYYVVSAMSYFTSYEASYKQQGYDIWSSKYKDDMTVSEYIMQVSLEQTIRDSVLYQEAKAHNMTLTQEEVSSYQEQVAASWDEIPKLTKKNYSLTEHVLEAIYEKKALADKYYDSIIDAANLDYEAICESIKLEDFSLYDYEYIEFPFGDSVGDDIRNYLSEQEKTDAYELITEIHTMLSTNSDMKAISVEKNLNYQTGSVLIGEDELDQTFQDNLIPLTVNGYSDVFETASGYVIVRKTADKSKMAYADAKAAAIKEANETVFQQKYDTILNAHTIKKNDEMINTVIVGN